MTQCKRRRLIKGVNRIVVLYRIYTFICSALQSEALPVPETEREEISLVIIRI